jgi:F-type H+-transporting ATPase subunit delta
MTAGGAVRRYAEAYFELAREDGDIPGWRDELRRAAETLSNAEVRQALTNPRLPMADRVHLALDLCDGIAAPARNLVRLLVERRRAGLLAEILDDYDRRADAASGVVRAVVTTAIAVTPEITERITAQLQQRLGTRVETEVIQDPAIIGGLVVRIGDRVIDDSIRTHLRQLQTALA